MFSSSQKSRSKLVMWVVGSIIAAAVLLVATSLVFRQQHAAELQQTLSNMRSLSCAFLEFDQEFGSYPNDETAPIVTEATGSELILTGPHSNAYFRQLIAYGILSEYIFFAKHPEGIHKPDWIMTPGHALAPGEVGLSYVYGLSSCSDPRLPLLLAPMKTGTHTAWRDTYGNKAAVLLIARSDDPFDNPPFELNRPGQILLADGSLLLDPAQPYWQHRPIDIRHPELP